MTAFKVLAIRISKMAICVVLLAKGGTRNAMIPASVTAPSAAAAAAIVRRATEPDTIGTWTWKAGGATLHLFAYKAGKAGTENKHELPPPHDTVLLFGDAVMFATGADSKIQKFNGADFTRWYNSAFGGFDDVGSEDSATDDEETDEEEEVEAEAEAEAGEDGEDASDEVEEEEEEAPVAVQRPVRAAKSKRNAKKLPAWYNLSVIKPEAYDAPALVPGTCHIRDAATQLIAAKLGGALNVAQQCDLERGVYNHSLEAAARHGVRCIWENPEFLTIYTIALRRTVTNLDAASYVGNARLLERLCDGEFQPHDVAFMTFSDLYPEKWRDLQERAVKRETNMLSVDKSMATDMFKCSRCGKRECTYYEMQTRSADEPMTQFIRCLNCGKQWRQ